MKLLDLTFPTPAENLACDEVLLDSAEANGGEVLRFWESPRYFVVVGYANKVETEVNGEACAAGGIPILRRCSGGGTVLQGPGCLNYTLVLEISRTPDLATISSTNKFIMERNCEAVRLATRNRKSDISVCGHTDLALGAGDPASNTLRKFSGNSQRRHKNALLFHGTFLLDFDLRLINRFLRMPSKQPEYRSNREHGDFLANLKLPASGLKQALAAIWNASGATSNFSEAKVQELAAVKYSVGRWNYRL